MAAFFARPCLGLRALKLERLKYHIVTLRCEVLPSRTADADHALQVLKQFVPDIKKVMLTSCHDGVDGKCEEIITDVEINPLSTLQCLRTPRSADSR